MSARASTLLELTHSFPPWLFVGNSGAIVGGGVFVVCFRGTLLGDGVGMRGRMRETEEPSVE